ncbi:cyclic nucleotide-binding domain-containing protein [Parasulfuritortus cantonensis]|uniref:Cyclic nucleotide-binding domain-containing protein n=1 Tax=Parasulfuritortus cantonensis TaxID=2528202 RepID=A0A4R1BIM7_9PROT|nr:cyclic nucleotide-binding domain-containing protein [Parasulfuritortus cantonensis]TCJ17143.1 cyclic nucleotide-binding domain-containing protein [Parasulfuritortus cantonensis]
MASVFQDLHDDEVAKIRLLGEQVTVKANEPVFREGDEADFLYFVHTGSVSLFIEKFNTRIEIQRAGSGDWFGEMALYSGGRRTASAATVEDTAFLRVGKEAFRGLLASDPAIEVKIRELVDRRNEKLVLDEKMVSIGGAQGRDMHIGIKGDPSLRESAMERARYESVVDRFLPELVTCFEDLLLNRTVHRILVGFNNGEIRLSTLLDPFAEEFHPAMRLLDGSYVERHFPKIDYASKTAMIRRRYRDIGDDAFFAGLPTHLQHGFSHYFEKWQPVPAEEVAKTIKQLPLLRSIPNFYIRSVTIGILKDAIHMQFNCDGTHIVSAAGYARFLRENL